MTDEKIRDYQRKARAGHDPVAELRGWVEAARKGALPHPDSAPLVERLARGELDRERLALAAYAGHQGALALIGEETEAHARSVGGQGAVKVIRRNDVTYREIIGWLSGVARWGTRVVALPQLAFARLVIRWLADACSGAHSGVFALVLEENASVIAPRWLGRPAQEILDAEILRPAERAFDCAQRLLEGHRRSGDRASLKDFVDAIEAWDPIHPLRDDVRPVALALRSALDSRGAKKRGSAVLAFGVNKVREFPPQAVASAMRQVLVDFALRREDGGAAGG
jgi:hypothetical protein